MNSNGMTRILLIVGTTVLLLIVPLAGLAVGQARGQPEQDLGALSATTDGTCDSVCVDGDCLSIPIEWLDPIVITDTFIIYPTSACLCENEDGSKRLEGEGEFFLPNIQTDETDALYVTFILDWPSLEPQCVQFGGTWEEGVPIGESGLLLTSIKGAVAFDPELTVEVSATIKSELQAPDGSGPAVTGEGTLSVQLEEPYETTFEGTLTVYNNRSVEATMTIDQNWGLAGSATLEGPVCNGPISLHVWEEGDATYGISGSASFTCTIEADSLTPEGWPDALPSGLPAQDIEVTAEGELGEFCFECQGGACADNTYGIWVGAGLDLDLPEWAVEPGTINARLFISSTGVLSATTNLERCEATSQAATDFGVQIPHSAIRNPQSDAASTQSLFCLNAAPTITTTSPSAAEEQPDASGIYTITWTADDPDNDAVISLYYDRDGTGRDGRLIACCLSEGDGTYAWDTSEVGSGTYTIYGRIDDGKNVAAVAYSDGTVKVVDTTAPAAPEGLSLIVENGVPVLRWKANAEEDITFSAGSTGYRSFLLQWLPNVEQDVVGYRVHYGPEPGLYVASASVQPSEVSAYIMSHNVANVTRFRLPHKPSSESTYAAVSAYDSSGNESPPSEAVRVRWPEIYLTTPVSGLNRPVHITHAGDGSGRLFVVEQDGRIRIIKDGTLLPTPFLDIDSRVGSVASEQGLLSVAFPPDYGRVFGNSGVRPSASAYTIRHSLPEFKAAWHLTLVARRAAKYVARSGAERNSWRGSSAGAASRTVSERSLWK